MRSAMTWRAVALAALTAPIGGCEIGLLAGGLAQNFEYQKVVEVLPEYRGLEGRKVAVVVNADPVTLYEHPMLARQIAGGVSLRLNEYVPGVKVLNPDAVLAWQFNTAEWNALPYGELCRALDVERVVYVDLYEYRLNPPGDSYIWEGMSAATIGVIERENIDPDFFAESMEVVAEFPNQSNVTRDELDPQRMEVGLLHTFIQETAFLFHRHLRPKHPDKYLGPAIEQPRAAK